MARSQDALTKTSRLVQSCVPRQHVLFRLLLTNAFGLATKMGDLQHIAKQEVLDVIVVTETKFTLEKVSQLDAKVP